jgi:hypothetical protein
MPSILGRGAEPTNRLKVYSQCERRAVLPDATEY